MNPKVWVCQVRREAFVGGESQRCRHSNVYINGVEVAGCGVMELIGGEPIEWCVEHGTPRFDERGCWADLSPLDPCIFESQIRVGP